MPQPRLLVPDVACVAFTRPEQDETDFYLVNLSQCIIPHVVAAIAACRNAALRLRGWSVRFAMKPLKPPKPLKPAGPLW